MQIFDVAFSRRMCCSRVCRARRYAGRPAVSIETPTRRPGRTRRCSSRVARNPALGPPKPSGIPNRWEEPTTTSAPSSPGGVMRQHARRSVVTATSAPAICAASIAAESSRIAPDEPGCENNTPKTSSAMGSSGSASSIVKPSGSARVCSTAIVWGCVSRSTTKRSPRLPLVR